MQIVVPPEGRRQTSLEDRLQRILLQNLYVTSAPALGIVRCGWSRKRRIRVDTQAIVVIIVVAVVVLILAIFLVVRRRRERRTEERRERTREEFGEEYERVTQERGFE